MTRLNIFEALRQHQQEKIAIEHFIFHQHKLGGEIEFFRSIAIARARKNYYRATLTCDKFSHLKL